ncbi:MAG: MnhB domain-containing protein [Anaerolineae bacterium]
MASLILRTVARPMLPILLLFSFFLLVRGHDMPGGGFVGGLVAAAAVLLQMLAYNAKTARRLLVVDPEVLLASGLGLALVSGLLPLLWDLPFLTARFMRLRLEGLADIEIGLSTVFDAGVYLVVVGVVLAIVLGLAEE